MKVKLKNCYLVKPAEPTWNGSLALSELDQIGSSYNYVSLIHLYKPVPDTWANTDQEAIFETIKSSLSKVLVPFYPLAGRLRRIGASGGRLQIECNGMGVHLTEAESDAKLDDDLIRDLDQHHQLVPAIDVTSTNDPIQQQLPLVSGQVTVFQCGGVCLGLAISHAAVDGQSAFHFYDEWARIARGEPLCTEPHLCRELLGDVVPYSAAEFDAPPILMAAFPKESEKSAAITRASLRLTKLEVEMLKRIANEGSGLGHTSFTRYESITAHIWRCACKARQHGAEQQTRLVMSVDIRRRMQPPLPQNYFGNTVIQVAALDCSGDLVCKPLSYAAKRIREAINKVTDENVKTIIKFLKGVDDLSSFNYWSLPVDSDQNKGLSNNENPDYVLVTSWLTLKLNGIDFGWGKEIYMGIVGCGDDGDCLIIPNGHDNDGSVDVVVCLQEAHMETFKKLFYENIELSVHESCG